jgi:redox-sensing transcriptional repressor
VKNIITDAMIINKKIISRLSHYRKAIIRLKELGFEKVFSETLGEEVGVTGAQVRKDFSVFGISGNKRGGYPIDHTLEKLQHILGKDQLHDVILVGAGNLGSAILQHKGFEKEQIRIVAGFDIDPAKINGKANIPIYHLRELKDFSKKHKIKIGIVAVPDIAAQEVCNEMLAAGIKGIINYTTMRFKGAENAVINNVYLQFELENVIYFTNRSMEK